MALTQEYKYIRRDALQCVSFTTFNFSPLIYTTSGGCIHLISEQLALGTGFACAVIFLSLQLSFHFKNNHSIIYPQLAVVCSAGAHPAAVLPHRMPPIILPWACSCTIPCKGSSAGLPLYLLYGPPLLPMLRYMWACIIPSMFWAEPH